MSAQVAQIDRVRNEMTTLRPVNDADARFLCRVYASTREVELRAAPWTDEEKTRFLQFQFDAQHQYYQEHYADADYSVIEVNGVAAGRFYLRRQSDELRVVDIALLPEYRGKGIGSQLIRSALAEATERRVVVRIHVEDNNPAMSLYERLGFVRVEQRGIYWLMQWNPPANGCEPELQECKSA